MTGAKKIKVLAAMSGGVDSSVAAALLLEQGFEVTGIFMCQQKQTPESAGARSCCSPADAEDARRVAQALGIELIIFPTSAFFNKIIDYFAAEYARGRTPNPCVHCNAYIKFGQMFHLADSMKIDYIATGHYARIIEKDGIPAIARARNRKKDQSYNLFGIGMERLRHIMLPIGDMEDKEAVRETARRMGLKVHDKPDSQEICFAPEGDYASIIRARVPEAFRPGMMIAQDGAVLGKHEGIVNFTIGQRRRLGVSAGKPLYVIHIDAATSTVVLGEKMDLICRYLRADKANWHRPNIPEKFEATVQIRSNHRGAKSIVRLLGRQRFEADFFEPVEAVAPGQAAVVYDGDTLIGGGWIENPPRKDWKI